MITKEDILKELLAGASTEEVAEKLASALNEAAKEKEQLDEEAKKKEEIENQKYEDMVDLLEMLEKYCRNYASKRLADSVSEILADSTQIQKSIDTIDELDNLFALLEHTMTLWDFSM